MGLNDRVSSVRAVPSNVRIDEGRYAPAPVTGQVSFFESEGFAGRSFTTEEPVANLQRAGFNDRAASAVVLGDRFEVCDDAGFGGRCVVLRPGRYPSLAAMGLNDRISSVRAVDWNARIGDDRYAPAPVPVYDSRRRGGERLYEANILSSRAVLATSGQRCWVESEQVPQERSGANVPGRSSAPSSVASSATRSAAAPARISPPSVASSPAPRWVPTLVAAGHRDPGRATLRERPRRRAAGLLGCHLQFPWSGPPRPDGHGPRADDHRQRPG